MDLQQRAINYLKNEMNEMERQKFEEELAHSEELRSELEKGREVLDLLEAANEKANIRRANDIIQQALKTGASDIHILPAAGGSGCEGERTTSVVFRIDGHLHEMMTIPGEFH